MSLIVTLFSPDTETGELAPGEPHHCDYVSLVNSESFGKPPIIAPGPDKIAVEGDTVLYINTSHVSAWTIKRED